MSAAVSYHIELCSAEVTNSVSPESGPPQLNLATPVRLAIAQAR